MKRKKCVDLIIILGTLMMAIHIILAHMLNVQNIFTGHFGLFQWGWLLMGLTFLINYYSLPKILDKKSWYWGHDLLGYYFLLYQACTYTLQDLQFRIEMLMKLILTVFFLFLIRKRENKIRKEW